MQLSHTAVIASLIICSLILGCTEQCCEKNKLEIEELKTEIRGLKQMEYTLQSLQSAVTASLKNESQKVASAELPIRRSTIPADSSYIDDPYLGDKSAPLVMMVFIDYQCRPCRRFVEKTLPRLREKYVDRKLLRLIVRDFPLSTNQYSKRAAIYANCAGEQGKYWEMFQALFDNPKTIDSGDFSQLFTLPSKVGDRRALSELDIERLERCAKSKKYDREILADLESGKAAGVKGAPGFFIAANLSDKQNLHGILIRGAQPWGVIEAEIEKLLPK